MTTNYRLPLAIAAILALGWAFPTPSFAAILTATYNGNPSATADLTSLGATDWAMWNYSSGDQSGTPSNEKSGGSAILTLSQVGGTILRGVGGTSEAFSYSDGISPTTQSPAATIAGISNKALHTLDAGYQLTITGDVNQERVVSIFTGAYACTGKLTATLNGATTQILTGDAKAGTSNPKPRELYTVNFKPDNPGDVLTISYVMTVDSGNTSSHVLLSAVAVAEVPEPGAASLLLIGCGLLTLSRQRRAE